MTRLIRRFLFVAVCIALPLAAQKLPLGQVVVTHVFNGPTDSPDPQFGLIELANGNFAGVTQGNAQNDTSSRMVYEMTPDGTVTPLIKFGRKVSQLRNNIAEDDSSFSLLQASDGNFYGVTTKSGASSSGNIFRLTPAGAYTVLYVFSIPPDGGLAEGIDGGLYGFGWSGTSQGLYRLDLATGQVSFVVTGSPVFPFGTPVFGADGNLTALCFLNNGSGPIGVCSFSFGTLSYSTVAAFPNVADGGYYSDPVAVQPDGSIWFAEPVGPLSTYGSLLEAVAGEALMPYNFTGAKNVENPISLISANDGNLYGVTFDNNINNVAAQQIFQYNPSSGFLVAYQLPDAAGLHSNGPLLQDTNGYIRGTSGAGSGATSPGAAFALNLGLPKPLPVVLWFSPSSGPSGTIVKVLGSQFVNVISVTLAGQPVTFTNPTAGAAFFTVPANAGSGSVVITTAAGSGTSVGVFQVE